MAGCMAVHLQIKRSITMSFFLAMLSALMSSLNVFNRCTALREIRTIIMEGSIRLVIGLVVQILI